MALDEMDPKIVPDDGTLDAGEFESLAGRKVQLDIDDAPFLLDPEDEPAPPPAETDLNLPAETAEAPPPRKKKRIFLLGALLLLALAGGVAAWLFLRSGGPGTPPPDQPPVIVVPSHPEVPAGPTEMTTRLEPFWVPVTDAEGRQRFLVATFVLGTDNGLVHQEIEDKLITLRDAIYYYLCNKDYAFLLDADNAEAIRADILNTINNYTVQGEVNSLYFDNYLLQ